MKTLLANPLREVRPLRRSWGSALLFGLCWLAWPAVAQVPGIISEQGTLLIDGTNFDGSCQFKFALVDTKGTRTFWSHDDTSIGGGEPAGPGIELPVVQGVFAVNLGDLSVSNMTRTIPASVFTNNEVCLRVWVNDGANGWQRLVPDRPMTAAGYALAAQTLLGPVQATQLPGTVAQLNKAQVFTGANYFLGAITAVNPASRFVGTFVGDGSGLTNIRASRILGIKTPLGGPPGPPLTWAYLEATQTFIGLNTFAGIVRATNRSNLLVGTHAGDGSALSNLTAASLIGTAPSAANFTGALAGDVTGTQKATVVSAVGKVSATDVARGATAANGAASDNMTGAIVKRDGNGDFAAGKIRATFSGDGSALTALNGTQITAGTVADGRLSANVARLNANQAFSGSNNFAGVAWLTNQTNLVVGSHAGDGSALSNLTAASLIGTAPSAANFTGALAGDVTGTQKATVVSAVGQVSATDVARGATAANGAASPNTAGAIVKRDGNGDFAAGTVTATFSGDGSALTALNGAQITTGRVADGRLSANVALLNANQAFTGASSFAGVVSLTNPANLILGHHSGDGSGLSNISATSITGTLQSLIPSGVTAVSTLPNDPSMISSGFRLVMTVPAPPWANGSSSGAPSARFGHTAVWDGQRFIVWGGRLTTGSSFLNSGGMYYPDSDRWSVVSTIGAPGARWGHTAVWSGDKMIVWGGNGVKGYLDSGGRFQPAQQLWATVSPSGAPAPRSGHIAVCADNLMLIWGGQNTSGLLNDGALYAPASDQWSTLPSANAPEARTGATAVWAGDRALVWGGQGAAGELNSGSQLVFSAGLPSQWRPMTLVNAPLARSRHSAVWTGQKMLVWGGQNAGAPLGDGAAYDPASDSWTPLPAVGSPAARLNHAALWTGQELLILGGSTGTMELASGSAYDPSTGLWRALSSSGSPQARTEAVAAWTDTEVLVFGGRAQGQAVASLQRLVPQPVWYFYRKL